MWQRGFFVVNRKTYVIRFRDCDNRKEGAYCPTRLEDWKIIPTPGLRVEVDSQVIGWKSNEPTAHIRERLVRFMTQKRNVYRNGWFYKAIYPYVVSDNDPNTYLILCQEADSKSCPCPEEVLNDAAFYVHDRLR